MHSVVPPTCASKILEAPFSYNYVSLSYKQLKLIQIGCPNNLNIIPPKKRGYKQLKLIQIGCPNNLNIIPPKKRGYKQLKLIHIECPNNLNIIPPKKRG